MASRLFFDPLVMLRTAPLVSATCTLMYARDQHFFLSGMNREECRKHSEPLISPYWKYLFRHGITFVVGAVACTFWTSVGNLYAQRAALHAKQSFWWYTAGAIFSASHLLFVPAVALSVQIMVERPDGSDVNEALDNWLWVNAWRTATVDFFAWFALAVAVVKTLEV